MTSDQTATVPAPGEAARIVFKRIGRRHEVPDLEIPAGTSADDTAELVYRYAGRFLGSREWSVLVDYDTGRVSIDGGRFGQGRLVPA